jgi:hypothetical protein
MNVPTYKKNLLPIFKIMAIGTSVEPVYHTTCCYILDDSNSDTLMRISISYTNYKAGYLQDEMNEASVFSYFSASIMEKTNHPLTYPPG